MAESSMSEQKPTGRAQPKPKHYKRGTVTPIRFIVLDGKLRCCRAYEKEQEGRVMFNEKV